MNTELKNVIQELKYIIDLGQMLSDEEIIEQRKKDIEVLEASTILVIDNQDAWFLNLLLDKVLDSEDLFQTDDGSGVYTFDEDFFDSVVEFKKKLEK